MPPTLLLQRFSADLDARRRSHHRAARPRPGVPSAGSRAPACPARVDLAPPRRVSLGLPATRPPSPLPTHSSFPTFCYASAAPAAAQDSGTTLATPAPVASRSCPPPPPSPVGPPVPRPSPPRARAGAPPPRPAPRAPSPAAFTGTRSAPVPVPRAAPLAGGDDARNGFVDLSDAPAFAQRAARATWARWW